jgi:hypothetical protein
MQNHSSFTRFSSLFFIQQKNSRIDEGNGMSTILMMMMMKRKITKRRIESKESTQER